MDSLAHYWDLTLVLTRKEIKVRYKNNVLGYLWSIANPLAFALVFYLVFKMTGWVDRPDFPIFLITGLFPWQWFSNSVNVAPAIFQGNGSIIKKINFPRNIIPLTIVLQDMLHFVLSIPVIVLFLLLFHRTPSWSWLYAMPLLLVLHLALTYGIVLIVSSTNLFFRDMEKLTNIFTLYLFYFTPVLYSVEMVAKRNPDLVYMFYLNPLAPLMISWRNLLLDGIVDPKYLVLSFFHAVAALLVGLVIYRKLSWRFAEVL